jgi:type-F conjugative transfer system pilin assembly protein TrbC
LVSSAIAAGDNEYLDAIANKNKHTQEYKNTPCLSCTGQTSTFNTDVINDRLNDINKTIKKYEIKDNAKPNIKEESKKQAATVDNFVRSEKGQMNVSQMKEKILKDKNYTYNKQENDPWKKVYDRTVYDYADDIKQLQAQGKKTILAPRERLFIIISSSMPDNVVKEYLRTVTESLNGQATVLMRGFVGGIAKMKQTVDYIKRVSEDGKYVGVEIHPNVVKQYGVERVPAVLYVKDYDPANDGNGGQFKKNNDYYIVYGAVSLNAAVKKIYEKYPSKGLSKMLSKLNGEGQGFYGNSK